MKNIQIPVKIIDSSDWVNELIDKIMDNVFKNYYIKAKKGKKKRIINKELNILKNKPKLHKISDKPIK